MGMVIPDFQFPVTEYTLKATGNREQVFLYSPQKEPDEADTLVVRQLTATDQNQTWIERKASEHLKVCSSWFGPVNAAGQGRKDGAHGVLLCDGSGPGLVAHYGVMSTHTYRRGDRIWLERGLVPTLNLEQDGVPVVNLDTGTALSVPLEHICFVPQWEKRKGNNRYHICTPGSAVDANKPNKRIMTIYFIWNADRPHELTYVWIDYRARGHTDWIAAKEKVETVVQVDDLFPILWTNGTRHLVKKGVLVGDEYVKGDVERFRTSREIMGGGGFRMNWGEATPLPEKRCNLDDCPTKNHPDMDLVPLGSAGFHVIKHYHVRDFDVDQCRQGAEHQGGHCILRSDRETCVYGADRSEHTCCRPRSARLLPVPVDDALDPPGRSSRSPEKRKGTGQAFGEAQQQQDNEAKRGRTNSTDTTQSTSIVPQAHGAAPALTPVGMPHVTPGIGPDPGLSLALALGNPLHAPDLGSMHFMSLNGSSSMEDLKFLRELHLRVLQTPGTPLAGNTALQNATGSVNAALKDAMPVAGFPGVSMGMLPIRPAGALPAAPVNGGVPTYSPILLPNGPPPPPPPMNPYMATSPMTMSMPVPVTVTETVTMPPPPPPPPVLMNNTMWPVYNQEYSQGVAMHPPPALAPTPATPVSPEFTFMTPPVPGTSNPFTCPVVSPVPVLVPQTEQQQQQPGTHAAQFAYGPQAAGRQSINIPGLRPSSWLYDEYPR